MKPKHGIKNDDNKQRWDLIPKGVIAEIVRVLTWSLTKYPAGNWTTIPNSKPRLYGAMMRHIDAWWSDGETVDPESKIHHLSHLGCCVLFLLWFEINGYPAEPSCTDEEWRSAEILNREG